MRRRQEAAEQDRTFTLNGTFSMLSVADNLENCNSKESSGRRHGGRYERLNMQPSLLPRSAGIDCRIWTIHQLESSIQTINNREVKDWQAKKRRTEPARSSPGSRRPIQTRSAVWTIPIRSNCWSQRFFRLNVLTNASTSWLPTCSENIVPAKVDATVENGILKIEVPKQKPTYTEETQIKIR